MIAEKAEESINQAVVYELQNIVKNYGATYASEHEGYAVLKEEIEEAADDLDQLNKDLAYLWALIKNNHIKNGNGTISEARDYAVMLAQEAVQVAAVCERFEETIKNK
jgi:uncharacterized protein YecA (UPF0149 family)